MNKVPNNYFLKMSFQMAQYGWGLMPETEFRARHELNEIPERKRLCIEAVKEQMVTRPDIG